MRYSYSALVLAAATFTSVVAVPSKHSHNHVHVKKDTELDLVERDIAVVYVTKTVLWEPKVVVPATPVPKPTTSTSVAAPVVPTSAPVVVAPVPTTSAAPVVVATTAAASPSSGSSSGSSGLGDFIDSVVTIAESALNSMLSLGVCAVGINSKTNNGNAWIGSDGPYTVDLKNKASEAITVVCWGSLGSWVNVKVPYITLSLAKGAKKTISFASGTSGACSAIYSDTKLVNGQISNTWIEFTFSPTGVVDISREVNMSGHAMEVVGPSCTTNMEKCVFVCDSGNVCTHGYSLLNCDPSSQPGAQTGVDTWGNGGASGGCGWLGASTGTFTASFSD